MNRLTHLLVAGFLAVAALAPIVASNSLPDPPGSPCPPADQCANRDPFANAGPDVTVDEMTAVRLNGTRTYDLDPDADLEYRWTIVKTIPSVPLQAVDTNADGQTDYYLNGVTFLQVDTDTPNPTTEVCDPVPPDPDSGVAPGDKACLILMDADSPTPCFLAPYLPPGFGPRMDFIIELAVADGEPSPPAGADPDPDSEIDYVTVSVRNSNQPPHGRGTILPPTCDEPGEMPPIEIEVYAKSEYDEGGAATREDFDIIADAKDFVYFVVPQMRPILDDTGTMDVTVSLQRIFTPAELNQGVPDSWKEPIVLDLDLVDQLPYNPSIVPGEPQWGHPPSKWPSQRESTWEGALKVTRPDIMAGVGGGAASYRVLATAIDQNGGTANNTEQDLIITFSCELCSSVDHELTLTSGQELEKPVPVDCFKDMPNRPPTGAPQQTLYEQVAIGPVQTARFNVTSFLKDVTPRDHIEPNDILVTKVTYQVCVGTAGKASIAPAAELPYPYFLNLDTLPEGAQELWVRAQFRDGQERSIVVRFTADDDAPIGYVNFPETVYQDIPFSVSVLVRDALDSTVTLTMPGVDLASGGTGSDDQVRSETTLGAAALPGSLPAQAIPDLSRAVRFDVPIVLDALTDPPTIAFDGIRDWLYDTNKDGVVDGFFDMSTLRVTKLLAGDCDGNKLADLSYDVDKNGRGCDADDIILLRMPCQAGDASPYLVDWNGNGGCDPSAKPEETLLVLQFIGLTFDRPGGPFLGTSDGNESLNAFLRQPGGSRLVVFTPIKARVLGPAPWDVSIRDKVNNIVAFTGTYNVTEPVVDVALKSVAVAGREARWGSVDEDGAFVPGEAFLASTTKKGKTIAPAFLPGDVVRIKATAHYKEGLAPLIVIPRVGTVVGATATNFQQVGPCDTVAPTFLVEPVPTKDQVIGCVSSQFAPGRHTVVARADIVATDVNETNPENQEARTEFEVYLAQVRFTPYRGSEMEFYIRAGPNGLPLEKGGVVDRKADKAYDLRLDEEKELYTFNVTIKETRGRTTTERVVAVPYDPLVRYDVANQRDCRERGTALAQPPTCRAINCYEEQRGNVIVRCGERAPRRTTGNDNNEDASGLGLGLLVLALAAFAFRRRR